LIITRATEHSIRAVLHLASKHPSPVVAKRDICEAEDITPAFLTKILQPLIRQGIVSSRRGVAGGFSLARDPEKITLWDVMKAVEEPLALNVCLTHETECDRSNYCPVHEMWEDVRGHMEKTFSAKSLADILRERDALIAKHTQGSSPKTK
jgi:Rrf2 family protein